MGAVHVLASCVLDARSGNVVLASGASSGTASCFLIPAFPERLGAAAPVIDGAILIPVTRYVKCSQTLKICAGFSGQSLFALVQEQESESIRH